MFETPGLLMDFSHDMDDAWNLHFKRADAIEDGELNLAFDENHQLVLVRPLRTTTLTPSTTPTSSPVLSPPVLSPPVLSSPSSTPPALPPIQKQEQRETENENTPIPVSQSAIDLSQFAYRDKDDATSTVWTDTGVPLQIKIRHKTKKRKAPVYHKAPVPQAPVYHKEPIAPQAAASKSVSAATNTSNNAPKMTAKQAIAYAQASRTVQWDAERAVHIAFVDYKNAKTTKAKKGREMTQVERMEIGMLYGWRCGMCQYILCVFDIDHVRPLCERGAHDHKNMWPLCGGCHNEKSKNETKRRVFRRRVIRLEKRIQLLGCVLDNPDLIGAQKELHRQLASTRRSIRESMIESLVLIRLQRQTRAKYQFLRQKQARKKDKLRKEICREEQELGRELHEANKKSDGQVFVPLRHDLVDTLDAVTRQPIQHVVPLVKTPTLKRDEIQKQVEEQYADCASIHFESEDEEDENVSLHYSDSEEDDEDKGKQGKQGKHENKATRQSSYFSQ
ncbi:HNH endonuclease [bacterium]|nr:HNH endonuclease [bacterium]